MAEDGPANPLLTVDNKKMKRFLLRETLYASKKGIIVSKAITEMEDKRYSFFTVKRLESRATSTHRQGYPSCYRTQSCLTGYTERCRVH